MSLSADDIASIVVGSIQQHGLSSSFNCDNLSETGSSIHPSNLAGSSAHPPHKTKPNYTQQHPEKFPRPGDLVWGRMPGFPFWPSFVTKSPTGQFKKENHAGKASYHVQFFNWNDESGWVNAVIEFDGLDSFKEIAAKKKSDKTYNPIRGAMKIKWEKAAREAEETMGLTRLERCQQYLVPYGIHSCSQPELATLKSSKYMTKTKSGSAVKPIKLVPTSVKKHPGQPGKIEERRKMNNKTDCQLPVGWKLRQKLDGGRAFLSPDGREFKDKTSALKYLAGTASIASSLPSRGGLYKVEKTCPHNWATKQRDSKMKEGGGTIQIRMSEEIPRNNLGNKRRIVGPKSFLRRLGLESDGHSEKDSNCNTNNFSKESNAMDYSIPRDEFINSEDDESVLRLPNGMKYRRGGEMEDFLDLDKLFDPSNGGIIEMVQLPETFLDHPSVSVKEKGNEMFLSSAVTGQFIAKKILYD